MKGSIPVPYLIAIILAVVVIVVLVYMYLSESGLFSQVIDEKYCQAKCMECKATGGSMPPECIDYPCDL